MSWGILDLNTKSLPQMLTYLRTYGKIEFSIKSKIEEAVNLFYTSFSIHLRGLQVWYGTPMPSGLKTVYPFRWKPIDFYRKCLLLLWPGQRSNWSELCLLGRLSLDLSAVMIKIFQTPKWQFVTPSKVLNAKTFHDPGDFENKVKVDGSFPYHVKTVR